MQAHELRKRYIEYFVEQGHRHVPSASLVPNDPTLLFTSAGMVQFKEIFWGHVDPAFPRATTYQKCFRTTDIENVGVTAYHHTFFEMLGNFSFGDYFREGAIAFAWEFLTKELGIPKDRLWVSVYEDDDEAFAIWRDSVGIPTDRIVRLGKDHNWWGPVGDAGPCGPDSEIFFDSGESAACGSDCRGVACDCDRFSEIWNLVFMEYDARPDGTFEPLVKKNIDTGMGLERTTAVLQGAKSNFDTDLFVPVLDAIDAAATQKLADKNRIDRNIIADHIRGILFLIADGVLPGNEKQGYVLRRILRRAIRSGERLALSAGTLTSLVEPVIDTLGAAYPEIIAARSLAKRVISHEEDAFRRTLHAGEQRLERILTELVEQGKDTLSGQLAFELYDTYGFPKEMTKEIVSSQGIAVDEEGFQEAMAEQRERSRGNVDNVTSPAKGEPDIPAGADATRFTGYESTEDEAVLSNALEKAGVVDRMIFPSSPFYAEAGGQISDTGTIMNLSREGRATVIEVSKETGGVFVHHVQLEVGSFESGDRCRLTVDAQKRKRIARNHTATHLLHTALRSVLGDHVIQAGSYVTDNELRFDFSHFEKLSSAETAAVEDMANEAVLRDLAVETTEMSLEQAKRSQAMAHFEDEYRGKKLVRVVSVGDFSRELCGGTHVERSGEIGLIKIVAEESVAAGTRRIRAITGDGALHWMRERNSVITRLQDELGEDPFVGLSRLRDQVTSLGEQLAALNKASLAESCDDLLSQGVDLGAATLYHSLLDLNADQLKELSDLVEAKGCPAIVLLASAAGDRGAIVCKTTDGLPVDAGSIVRTLTKAFGGGGGGTSTFAQGGGLRKDALNDALAEGVHLIRAALN